MALGNVLLCLSHRLMSASPRAKAEAVFAERRVPLLLEHLIYRLLNEAIQYGRNAKFSHPAVRLGDFHTLHRLRLIGPVEELNKAHLVTGAEVEFFWYGILHGYPPYEGLQYNTFVLIIQPY